MKTMIHLEWTLAEKDIKIIKYDGCIIKVCSNFLSVQQSLVAETYLTESG